MPVYNAACDVNNPQKGQLLADIRQWSWDDVPDI